MYSGKYDSKSVDIYKDQIKNNRPLTKDEEAEAARGIKKGNKKSLDKLVKANLRFVVGVAYQYQNQGLPFGDLINIGNIGLIKAAKRFNPDKNFRFISYSVWYIRQAILSELAIQSRKLKIPLNSVQHIYKAKKAIDKLEQKFCRTPTTEEIAEETGLKPHLIKAAYENNKPSVSFDATVGEDKDTYYDLYCDNNQEMASDAIEREDLANRIDKALDNFTEREKNIIIRLYGLNGQKPEIMEHIGETYGITRERVRQLKKKVFKSLRYSSYGLV